MDHEKLLPHYDKMIDLSKKIFANLKDFEKENPEIYKDLEVVDGIVCSALIQAIINNMCKIVQKETYDNYIGVFCENLVKFYIVMTKGKQ